MPKYNAALMSIDPSELDVMLDSIKLLNSIKKLF